MWIPDTLLIAPCSFGRKLPAAAVGEAIARGIRRAGRPEPDVCPIEESRAGASLRETLVELSFEERMLRSRAVVVGAWWLERDTLRESAVFEIATRARQAGVPAYGVAGESLLDEFDARILDLQAILTARDARGLSAAGRKLAGLA
jgi:glycerate kinase